VLGGIGEMRGGGGFNWKPAEFTDDTQMALALAESLIANDGFDAADLWNRWQTWARTARDVGTHTREVLAERSHVGAAPARDRLSDGSERVFWYVKGACKSPATVPQRRGRGATTKNGLPAMLQDWCGPVTGVPG
jgi:hypothetical protein